MLKLYIRGEIRSETKYNKICRWIYVNLIVILKSLKVIIASEDLGQQSYIYRNLHISYWKTNKYNLVWIDNY